MQAPDNYTEDLCAPSNGATRPQFEPDDITRHAVTDTPSEVIALIGYLGEGGSDAFRRLYKDDTFRKWLAIADNDIVDRFSVAGSDKLTEGESVVWVRRSASVVLCESVPVSTYESAPISGRRCDQQSEHPGVEGRSVQSAAYQWPRRRP